jgi:regulator of nonsense transcripts 2
MKSKQQAEREEQQRIKNLVLNYDLRDENDNEGDSPFLYTLQPNRNRKHTETMQGLEKQHNPFIQPRIDKAGNNRSNQRARKLQLSDVEWYGNKRSSSQTPISTLSQPSLSGKKVAESDSKVSGRRDSLTPNENFTSPSSKTPSQKQSHTQAPHSTFRRGYRKRG